MSAPSATIPTPNAPSSNGHATPHRDVNGRFTKGNSGGPGNPYARRCAELRQLFHEAVSKEEVRQLVRVLYQQALQGDTTAMRIFFAYCLGTPEKVVNPDTIDAQEWQTWQQLYCRPEEMSEMLPKISKELYCAIASVLMPALVDKARDQLTNALLECPLEPANHTQKRTKPKADGQSAKKPELEVKPPSEVSATKQAPASRPAAKPTSPARERAMLGHTKAVPGGSPSPKRRQQTAANGQTKAPVEPEQKRSDLRELATDERG